MQMELEGEAFNCVASHHYCFFFLQFVTSKTLLLPFLKHQSILLLAMLTKEKRKNYNQNKK